MMLITLSLSWLLLQEPVPEEPLILEEPIAEEPILEEPILEEPELVDITNVQDPERDALAAWLGEDTLDPATATARFLHDLEFGVTLDLITAFTEAANSVDRYNDLRLRSLQLHFASPVAETGWAFATVDYADGGGRGASGGSEWVLREGGLWIDQLPGELWPQSLRLEIGKFAADLGAWNTVYANEFPAPSLDAARRTLFGGNLMLTGFALHQGLPFDGGHFRWSVALAGDVERQDVDLPGNGIDRNAQVPPTGRFGIANWAGTARATSQWDLGQGHHLRAGASLFYAPNELLFTAMPAGGTARQQTRHSTYGFDAGWRWQPRHSRLSHELSAEVWVDGNQYRDGAGGLRSDDSRAEWLWYELSVGDGLHYGLMFSRHDLLGLNPVDLDGSYHSAYATCQFSPSNRVSLFLTHTNPSTGLEKFFTVGAEWVVDLGAKRSNLIPRWN